MKMDVYNCEECANAFAVEENVEPSGCPICDSELVEFSYKAIFKLEGSE